MDYMELLDVFIRAITSLIVLFVASKMLGKKQVSELSIFDYVIGISIGNFAAEVTLNLESKIINGALAVLLFGFIAYLVSIITLKSMTLRRFFMGVPTIIIQNGKIFKNNLRKNKIDINDMLEQCRTKGYFDVSQIEFAVLEVNGDLSILPKSQYRPLNPDDMNLKVAKEGLVANIIIDGKIMINNLKRIGKDDEWLLKQLKVKGKSLDSVLLATVDNKEKLVLYGKNEDIDILNILE